MSSAILRDSALRRESLVARMELGLPPVGRGQRPDGTGPYRIRPAGRRREDAAGSMGL